MAPHQALAPTLFEAQLTAQESGNCTVWPSPSDSSAEHPHRSPKLFCYVQKHPWTGRSHGSGPTQSACHAAELSWLLKPFHLKQISSFEDTARMCGDGPSPCACHASELDRLLNPFHFKKTVF
eukprot:603322-Pelagomonas_calceolata.AAC.2